MRKWHNEIKKEIKRAGLTVKVKKVSGKGHLYYGFNETEETILIPSTPKSEGLEIKSVSSRLKKIQRNVLTKAA